MAIQSMWRIGAVITIACCALMAWCGTEWQALRTSATLFMAYWGVFIVLFLVSLFIVWLDVRYIRLEYVAGKRTLFRQTLGQEDFRKSLLERRASPEEEQGKRN